MIISVTYPWPDYRLSPNGRVSHRVRALLVKAVRSNAAQVTWDRGLRPDTGARLVKMIFHPPSARWDDDNARAMGKSIRDGIAEALGVDDKIFTPEMPVGNPVKSGAVVALFEIPDA